MTPPTPGRFVVFVLKDGTERPALIIDALQERCCLHVFMKPLELLHESSYQALVPYSAEKNATHTWHWPNFLSQMPKPSPLLGVPAPGIPPHPEAIKPE